MGFQILREHVAKMHRAERDGRGDAHRATGCTLSVARFAICFFERFENALATLVIDLADVGQAQAARRSLQQPGVESGFDRADVLASHGGREPETPRGGGETTLVDGGDEYAHPGQPVHSFLDSIVR